MPIQMQWEDAEKTILRHTYEGHLSVEDMRAAIEENYALQTSVEHPVDVISDARSIKSFDPKLLSSTSGFADRKAPTNQRMIVVVGTNLMLKTLLKLAKRFASKTTEHLHHAESMEQALALLVELRQRTGK